MLYLEAAPYDSRALERIARGCLLGALLMLPIQRWFVLHVGTSVFITDLLIAASHACLFGVLVVGRTLRLLDRPALAAGLAYGAALLLSIVATHGPLRHVAKLVGYMPYVLSPVLAVALLRDRPSVRRAFDALAAAAAFAFVVGALTCIGFYVVPAFTRAQLMCGYGAFPAGNYPRLCAPFFMQNALAGFYVALVPFLLAWTLRRWGLVASLGVAALASVVMLFTLSAAVGAFAVAVVFVLAPALGATRAGRVLVPLAWTAAIAAEAASIFVSVGSFVARGTGHFAFGARDYSFWDGSRPSIMNAAASTVARHPWFGAGYGVEVAHVTDPRSFVSFDDLASVTGPVATDLEAHDIWLSIAGQAGFVGLALFLVLAWVVIKPVSTMRVDGAWTLERRAVLASVLGGLGLHGIFCSNEEQRHFFLVLGVGLALARVASSEAPDTSPAATVREANR